MFTPALLREHCKAKWQQAAWGGGKARVGEGHERGQSWRLLTGSTGREEDGVEDQSFCSYFFSFFSVL